MMDKQCRKCDYFESQHPNPYCDEFDFNGWFLDENGICRHDIFSTE